MVCPQCGASVPDDAAYCPTCGAATHAAPPPPAVLVDPQGRRLGDKLAKTQVVKTSEYAAADPGARVPGKGLGIGLLVASLLVGTLAAAGAGWALYAAVSGSQQYRPPTETKTPDTGALAGEGASTKALEGVVGDFYGALNSGDYEEVKSLLSPDLSSQLQPGDFEGWEQTTFRPSGVNVDGETAKVTGTEEPQAFGDADGSVVFSLVRQDGKWLIDDMSAPGDDGDASGEVLADPRALVAALLEARRAGDVETIKALTTQTFQEANGDLWLDGIATAEYFTSYTIDDVTETDDGFTVTVTEEWNSGTETARYGVIPGPDDTLAVDSWESAQ